MGSPANLGNNIAVDLEIVLRRLCELEEAVRVLVRSMAVLCIKHQVEVEAPNSHKPIAALREGERDLVLRTYEACHKNQRVAAGELGITPRMMNYRLKKLGLTRHYTDRRKPRGPLMEHRT